MTLVLLNPKMPNSLKYEKLLPNEILNKNIKEKLTNDKICKLHEMVLLSMGDPSIREYTNKIILNHSNVVYIDFIISCSLEILKIDVNCDYFDFDRKTFKHEALCLNSDIFCHLRGNQGTQCGGC